MSQLPTSGNPSTANVKSVVRASQQNSSELAAGVTSTPGAPKTPGATSTPGVPSKPPELVSLRQDMRQLVEQFEKTHRGLTDFFATLLPETPRGVNPEIPKLLQRIDDRFNDVLSRVGEISQSVSATTQAANSASGPELQAETQERLESLFMFHRQAIIDQVTEQASTAIASQCASLRNELGRATTKILDAVAPPSVEEPTPETSSSDQSWQIAIFGSTLANDPGLCERLVDLCQRVLGGDSVAGAFAGHLLIFQNSPLDRRPQLLKDLGEAYYRCFPKDNGTAGVDDPLEQSLVKWLVSSCEQAGFQNSIELVHPGERFDASRHVATERGGVEITDVHGWVVLRNRDKVYTKAVVSAR